MECGFPQSYCLFCTVGREQRVCAQLQGRGYAPLAPQVKRWRRGKGPARQVCDSLLPGYVFDEMRSDK